MSASLGVIQNPGGEKGVSTTQALPLFLLLLLLLLLMQLLDMEVLFSTGPGIPLA